MKNININLFLLFSLLLYFGCEKVIFLPIQGDVDGIITDNNGQPVAGATVTATYEAPTQYGEAQEETKTTTTDSDGYYHLANLWDEVRLQINHAGLEPVGTRVTLTNKKWNVQVDLALNGSPTIQRVTFDKTTLSVDTTLADTIQFDLEVADTYNNQSGDYQGNLLLEDGAGHIRRIVSATVAEQSLERVLLAGTLTAGELPAGTYRVKAEVTDPDGNTHWIFAEASILLQ
ncbi:MAG: carboxypeptidase regulatory-like domain-containing protein [Lewinella sp.]|nr:carboxypeptidase regulatory-like domain-containing protein [Lewinella sp.]